MNHKNHFAFDNDPLHLLTRRQLLLSSAVSGLTLSSGMAQADAWPNKPLRLVVPFAPGGSSGIVARA